MGGGTIRRQPVLRLTRAAKGLLAWTATWGCTVNATRDSPTRKKCVNSYSSSDPSIMPVCVCPEIPMSPYSAGMRQPEIPSSLYSAGMSQPEIPSSFHSAVMFQPEILAL